MIGRAMYAVPLAGALFLAGCSGGDGAGPGAARQATPGIAVGEPNGGAPVVSEFIKMAQAASCADQRNRLFVIDGKQVFWDRAGSCADNSYAQVLYGFAPEQVLCSSSDTIMGPKTFCADDTSRALFDTIQKNLGKPDLGLAGHKVDAVAFLPAAGTPITFQTVAVDRNSGVTEARTVVVKDADSFARLWAEHGKNRIPAPVAPGIDFSRQMVLAVFDGYKSDGCHSMGITRVASGGDRIVVEWEERDRSANTICTQAVMAPVQMIAVDRSDAPVDFVLNKSAVLAFTTLDQGTRSGVTTPANVVVRDATAWAALWSQHAGANSLAPTVDFSRQMVIGVFLGQQGGGCFRTTISNVSLTDNKLTVLHQDSVPGPLVLCTAQVTTPAHLVAVDRSDAQVVFAKEVVPL